MIAVARTNRSWLGRWFWTTDRVLLLLILLLIGIGLIAVAAASPAAAHRYSGGAVRVSDLFYFKRQLFWVALGVPVLLGVSMLSIPWARRLSVLGTAGFLGLLLLVPLIGAEVNGATRWLAFGGFQLQPSEFLKPCLIVTTAWLLAARFDDRTVPVLPLSFGLVAIIAALLVKQPDLGQAVLILGVWMAQACLAGMGVRVIMLAAGGGVGALGAAYAFLPHVTSRVDRFITGGGDTYQIDRALDAIRAGGLFGVGPGEGQMKFRLPEPQTDYIFSVIGEEFGAVACIMLAILYLAVVTRVLMKVLEEDDPFVFLASTGLAIQFGGQAVINMAVNLNLMPSKGMTLPLISHGGSSFIALSLGLGLLLALTRRNPWAKASPYAGKLAAA